MQDALASRGVHAVTARLAAAIGILALDTAYQRWTAVDDETTFAHQVAEALDELAAHAAQLGGPRPAVS